MAARVGSVEFCELLLTHKALVDCDPSCRERTPLHVAASCGHTAVAELLLEYGAECTAPDSDGRTPMAAAEAAGAHRARVRTDRRTDARTLFRGLRPLPRPRKI